MAVSGPAVQEQDLVAHLFAPMDGPLAGDAHTGIRRLWSACRASLGMTEPIPLRGLSDDLPNDFSVLPDFTVIAGQQSPDANFQAALRRDHDVLNLSVLLAGPKGRGTSPPLWPELDELWATISDASTGLLIGHALLYLAKVQYPTANAPPSQAGLGEMLGAFVPRAPLAGWWRAGLRTSAGLTAWEVSARDDPRAERRFAVAARPEADAELSAWTWSGGHAAMPPFARYLMHMAKIRYELRVHSGATRAATLCRETDQAIAEVRALVSNVTDDRASGGEDHRIELIDRIAALRRTGVRMAELRTALTSMRRTAEIAEANAVRALGADLPDDPGPDFASDDRAVTTLLCQQLDDDVAYLRASIEGASQVIGIADAIMKLERNQPSRPTPGSTLISPEQLGQSPASPAKGGYRGRAVVLCALNLEFMAVRSHVTDLHVWEHPRGTRFEAGELPGAGWQVVLASIGWGNVGAGVIAERAISLFDPDVLLCVGVAGSLKDNVRLGDIVVATRVDAYSGGTAAEDFLARPRTWPAPHRLEQLARELDRTGGWRSLLPAQADGKPPTVHFRPIAAGEVVLDSRKAALFAQLRLHNNDAAAIEMEGAGIAQAAHLNDSLPALVIRGISDQADGTKAIADREGWQQRASANAAAFTVSLLANLNPPGRPARS